MKKLSSLSIFFPAYNDDRSIVPLVKTAYEEGKKITADLEVIVVDDGSRDDTEYQLGKMQKKYKTLRIIGHKKNLGYGRTLAEGFQLSTKEFVFYTDGDGQYDVKELPKLVEHIDSADIVNGWKLHRSDPWFRIVLGDIYRTCIRWIFQLPIRDVDCDFRLIRKSLLLKLHLQSTSGSICVELIKQAQRNGASFYEIPVHHYPRSYGRSEFFRFSHLKKTLQELMTLWRAYMLPS